jgi:HlyD family secretion protein
MKRLPRPRHLLVLLLLLPLGIVLGRLAAGEKVRTVGVVRAPLVETVISTGRVITPARVALGAVMAGTAARVAVEEGDRVRAGQVLVVLDDVQQRAALAQAEQGVLEADARLDQLERVGRPVADQVLRQASANLELAAAEHERARRLFAEGFYNQSRLDEARRALDNARSAREAAEAQARANRPDGADVRLARVRQARARAALELARARLADTRVRAPSDGQVLRKLVEPGDVVTAGRVLLEMAAAGETQVLLQIDEKNLGRLRIGQRASVLADAYPERPFQAGLFFIAPGVDARKGSVEVKLRVPEPPDFLKPDMTVSAEIEVGRRDAALVLPSEVLRDAGGRPWVLVADDGRAVRRPVRLGLRGTGRVEVVEGLAAGDRVIPPEAPARAGQRVRVAE